MTSHQSGTLWQEKFIISITITIIIITTIISITITTIIAKDRNQTLKIRSRFNASKFELHRQHSSSVDKFA